MKILFTGATGFLGRYIVPELLKKGHDIIIVSSKTKNDAQLNGVKFLNYEIKPIKDNTNLFEYFDYPDIVLHFAWWGLPNYNSIHHLTECLPASLYFLNNLIENGLSKVVIAGTCFEYGLKEGELLESDDTNPVTLYGMSKDVLSKSIEKITEKNNCEFAWLRFFYVYGEGQLSSSLYTQLKTAVVEGEKTFKMSKGSQLRDYLSVETLAQYVAKIVGKQNCRGIINVCSGKPISVESKVQSLLQEWEGDIKLEKGYYQIPDYEPINFWGNNQKLKNLLVNE